MEPDKKGAQPPQEQDAAQREAAERKALRSSIYDGLALFTQLGFTMGICMVLSVLAGHWLDKWLGTTPWLTVVLAFLGAAAALKLMYDSAKGK